MFQEMLNLGCPECGPLRMFNLTHQKMTLAPLFSLSGPKRVQGKFALFWVGKLTPVSPLHFVFKISHVMSHEIFNTPCSINELNMHVLYYTKMGLCSQRVHSCPLLSFQLSHSVSHWGSVSDHIHHVLHSL